MKKLLKLFKERKNQNNSGMTLVEVLVGTTIMTILAGMILTVANFSMRSQSETERWNEQTDLQVTYLSSKRYGGMTVRDNGDGTKDIIDDHGGVLYVYGGETQYTMVLVDDNNSSKKYDVNGTVEMYRVDTLHGELRPYDEANIGFFRVS